MAGPAQNLFDHACAPAAVPLAATLHPSGMLSAHPHFVQLLQRTQPHPAEAKPATEGHVHKQCLTIMSAMLPASQTVHAIKDKHKSAYTGQRHTWQGCGELALAKLDMVVVQSVPE